MTPLGFFRSGVSAERPPSSPTPRSPGFRTVSDKDKDRSSTNSPPPTPIRSKAPFLPQATNETTATLTAGSSRLRRLKSGSFSFGRYDAPLSPSTSTYPGGLSGVNELDELGRRTSRSGRERDDNPPGALDRSATAALKVLRPRGVSESAGDRVRPRLWFSRNKANTSALSDDEGDAEAPATGEMVISAPMPPLDGRPIKSANAMEDLMELQRNVGAGSTRSNRSDSVSSASIRKAAGAFTSFDDSILRPVTPPSVPRMSSGEDFLTPLSPPKRQISRARKSPRIAPLVFRDTSMTSPVPSSTSAVLGTVQPPSQSKHRDESPASLQRTQRIELPSPSGSVASARLQSPTRRQVPPSPSKSSIKGWQAGSLSNGSSSSSSPKLEQAFVQTSRGGRSSIVPPRSISDEASSRSSPEPMSTENEEETEELRSFDAEDPTVDGAWSTTSMPVKKMAEPQSVTTLPVGCHIPGYTVEVVCSEEAGRDAGVNHSGEEIMRWEVVIRKSKSAGSNPASVPAPTSPIALRLGQAASVAPPAASSINLSLSLDRPTGKLVFISLPVDPQQTPSSRPRANSRGGVAGAKVEVPESPSPSSSRFQTTIRGGAPSAHPRSPLPAANTSASLSSLPPPPPLSPSPKIDRFPSQRRKAPPISTLPPPSPSSSFGVARFPDSPQLVTPRSPPVSPREVFMQRRKASLQDGVLFTPDL